MSNVNKKTIKVVLINNVAKWAAFLTQNRYDKKDKSLKVLIIDFNEAYFIYPFHLVSLACLIEEYFIKNIEIEFVYNNKGLAGQYLEKINFYDFWKKDFDRNSYENEEVDHTVRLWKLDKERLSGFANYVQQFFETHFLKSKDLMPLNIAIAEACNNILDHSSSKVSGFILTQYYKNKKFLIVSICDFGIGIPKKINDFRIKNNESKLSPIDAIEKALEKRYTTRSAPHNAGLGLDNIFSNVKETKGNLLIISKNACLLKRNGDIDVKEIIKPKFPGTHLVIWLGTGLLNDKELEIEQEIDVF